MTELNEQIASLCMMVSVGVISVAIFEASWSDMTKTQRRLSIAWLTLWFTPPLYFIWTKGVMG